jgi:D-serine deaminase-like pyridoxal phosphate-dependent protein
LHGLPLTPSAVPRLATVAQILGEDSISVFADHPSHIDTIDRIDSETWPGKIPVWVLIDVGDHREGIAADSTQLADIAKKINASTRAKLAGVYTHMGSSYGSSSPQEALKYMSKELEGLRKGALSILKSAGIEVEDATRGKITISLGASPTATSTQNLLEESEDAKQYRAQIEEIKKSFEVELHAGVYPVMDMQQIATRARPQHSPSNPGQSLLSWADLGFRIMVEVASLYPERTDKPEALVAAGSIALGREPCKSYPGWAVVTPWPAKFGAHYDPEGSKTGWIVGRISQEHGVLTWEGPRDNMRQLNLGEKLMLWPNHACIAGVNFGWYLVVDSDKADRDEIQDVWVRWRGW